MGITNSNKVISADRIACDGAFRVTLALTAAPDIVANPTDIVLVLDRSGSLAGQRRHQPCRRLCQSHPAL